MAASTLINGVAVNGLATSANYDLALTSPVTGVEVTLKSVSGGVFGVVLLAQLSDDGTNFANPVKVGEAVPGETRAIYHDAKNCAKVRYTVHNNDATNAATVTLIVNQV